MQNNTESKIILGDQSPWAGGYCRYSAVVAAGAIYCIQNADAPWVQQGLGSGGSIVKQGWIDYWNLAVRIPWTWSTPSDSIENIRQSLKGPKGLTYLAGNTTSETICSEDATPQTTSNVQAMLLTEIDWAKKVGEMMGNGESAYRANHWKESVQGADTLTKLFGVTGSVHGIEHPDSIVALFSDTPPLLIDKLGPSYYWVIDSEGKRKQYTGIEPGIVVPKGKALPLELCARDMRVAFTALSYITELSKLRDRYVPDLILKFLQITFNWELETDPMVAMVDVYQTKRKEALKDPSVDLETTDRIRSYWKGRPTTISHHVLGGDLNPHYEYTQS